MINNDNINSLIECLEITFTSPDHKVREEAEAMLASYEENIILYSKALLEAILPEKSRTLKLKISIVLQLKRVLMKYVESGKDCKKEEEIIEIIKLLVNILIKPNLEEKLIQNLSDSLIIILNTTNNTPNTLIEFAKELSQSLGNTSIPLESFKGVLTILSSLVKCDAFTTLNDVAILTSIIPLTNKILEMIQMNLQQVSIDTNREKFLYCNKAIGEIYCFYYNCKAKKASNEKLKQFILESLAQLVPFGLKIVFNVIPNYVPNPPVCWTKDKSIDFCLNNMKYHILRFICLMIKYLPSSNIDVEIINMHNEIIKMISLSLEFILLNKYEDLKVLNRESNNKYSQLIAQMIYYLSNAFSINIFRNAFKPFSGNFFKNIIIPYLLITPAEIEQSVKDTDSYSVLVEDIIFDNKSKTIKSSLSLLLKHFINGENEKFISDYVFELLDTVLKSSNPQEKTNSLISPDDHLVKINPSNEARLDLCLLIFSILHSQFTKNQIDAVFCSKIKDNLPLLFSDNAQTFIKHKICIILRQYFKVFLMIDKNNSNNTTSTVYFFRYLYQNILADGDRLVTEESIESLIDIVKNIKKDDTLNVQVVFNLLIEAMKIIPTTSNSGVFRIIYEIKLKLETTDYDAELYKLLLKRISIEAAQQNRLKIKEKPNEDKQGSLSTAPHKTVNHTEIITNCFNVTNHMMTNELFVQRNSQLIQECLSPLTFYIKMASKIDFDTDIILMASRLIKGIKSLPEVCLNLLPQLHKHVKKNNGMTGDLYELMNFYLIFGSGMIEQSDIYMKAVNEVLKQSTSDPKEHISCYYAILLMHIWLINSNTIPLESVERFIAQAIKKLSKVYDKLKQNGAYSFFTQYNFIFYLLIVYSSFAHYPSLCIELLNKNNQMAEFLQWSEKLASLTLYSYPMKMIIFSLCILINSDCFTKDNFLFLNLAFKYLVLLKNSESKKLKQRIKLDEKILKDDSDDEMLESEDEGIFGSDDDEKDSDETDSDDSDDDNCSNTEVVVNKILSKTINPLSSVDEFKQFKSTLEVYKSNYPQQFAQWTASLSDCDRERLNALLQTVRVDINYEQSNFSIPRKIIQVKRNNQKVNNTKSNN